MALIPGLIPSLTHAVILSLIAPSPMHSTTSPINILDYVNLNGSVVFNIASSYSLWFHFPSTLTCKLKTSSGHGA